MLDIFQKDDISIYKISGPQKIERAERRRSFRAPTPQIEVKFYSENNIKLTQAGVLYDISLTGVKIEVFKPLRINEILHLNFLLPTNKNKDTSEIRDLLVKVVREIKMDNRLFYGAQILNFKLKQETILTEYIINIQRATNWDKHLKKVLDGSVL